MRYDATAESFTGAVTNPTTAAVENVRIELHLSSGTEIGPSLRQTLNAGQTSPPADSGLPPGASTSRSAPKSTETQTYATAGPVRNTAHCSMSACRRSNRSVRR